METKYLNMGYLNFAKYIYVYVLVWPIYVHVYMYDLVTILSHDFSCVINGRKIYFKIRNTRVVPTLRNNSCV